MSFQKDILTRSKLDILNKLSCPSFDWCHIQAAFPPCAEFSQDRLQSHPDHDSWEDMESDRYILLGITHLYTQPDSSRHKSDNCTEACPVDKIWRALLNLQTTEQELPGMSYLHQLERHLEALCVFFFLFLGKNVSLCSIFKMFFNLNTKRRPCLRR